MNQVVLVPDHNELYVIGIGKLFDLLNPLLYLQQRFLDCDIVDEDGSIGVLVVHRCD
jgi:hypothetical protein